MILERLPATLELAVTALVLATGGGILLGVCSVWRRRAGSSPARCRLGMLGIAVPNFVWGLLLIVVFGAILQVAADLGPHRTRVRGGGGDWLGRGGRPAAARLRGARLRPRAPDPPGDRAGAAAPRRSVFRTIRSDLIGALGEEYVVTERMKGLGEARILFWRALRNALIPTDDADRGPVRLPDRRDGADRDHLRLAGHRAADPPGVPVPGLPLIQGIVLVYAVTVILSTWPWTWRTRS